LAAEISQALPDVMAACKVAGFDLIVVETSGIGQGDAAIVPHVDLPMYVMTPEFGAASQLEKIDMLDFAEFVAINKFDRKGAQDALRDVAKQVQRNKEAWTTPTEQMPVFGTMAARFNDDGVTALYQAMLKVRLPSWACALQAGRLPAVAVRHSTNQTPIVPAARTRYLAEISATPCAATKSAPVPRPSWPEKFSSCAKPRACWPSPSRARPAPPRPRWTWPTSASRCLTPTLASSCSSGRTCKRPTQPTNTW
jgi:isobutyryl-CoA mutase